MASTFLELATAGSGIYQNDYLFSNLSNWSGGALPATGTAVTLNMALNSTIAVDNVVTFGALTFNNSSLAATLLVGGSLTAASIGSTAGSITTKILSGGTLNFTNATAFGASSKVIVGGALNGTSLGFYQGSAQSTLTVGAGGVVTATSLDLTGVLATTVSAGGSLTSAVTLAAGTLDIAGNATISTLTMKAGTFTVEGTASIGGTGTGTFTINQGGSLSMTSVPNLVIANNGSGKGEVFNINGGKLTVAGNADNTGLLAGSSFNFGPVSNGPGSFSVTNYSATTFGYAITGLVAGDSFEIGTLRYTLASYNSSNHALTLSGAGQTLTLTSVLGTNLSSGSFTLSTATNGGTILNVSCFLSGTRIETTRGEVEIEALAEGDEVVTLEDDQRRTSRVCWLGSTVIEAGGTHAAPIRIRAHAFAPGEPTRDLLVTPEHCILVDGGLIPARMLVNGVSILTEQGLESYTVHHVQCERHVILFAGGLTTESYLDTGTSGNFGTGDRVAADWSADAAAPLTTSRAIVEPIWRRLLERAGAEMPMRQDTGTDDPDLRLRLQDGSVLRARTRRGKRHFFVLPAGTGATMLLSRFAVPAEIEGPFVDDRRRLGVQVSRVLLWNGLASEILPLADGRRPGWHASEAGTAACWTDGQADLALPPIDRNAVLEIELAGIPSYPPRHRPVALAA